MPDYTVVGHIALDRLIRDGSEEAQLGGPPTYVSLAARMLGRRVDTVSKVGEDLPVEFIMLLQGLGIPVEEMVVKGSETTRFVHDYRFGERRLRVMSVCDEIRGTDLEDISDVALVSPIAGEVSGSTISQIDAEIIALDPQGLVRVIGEDGSISYGHWFERAVLERVTVFKSSEMELAHVVGGRDTLTRLGRICECGVEVAMATRGRGGAYLVDSFNAFQIPAALGRRVVDPTGAGDVFFGTFLSAYLRGEDPLWCASKGAALASALIETGGAEVKASIGEVFERAEEVYEGTGRL